MGMWFAINVLDPAMDPDRTRKPGSTPNERRHTERRAEADWPFDDERRCVRLTRKYAQMIDGVDLEDVAVGDLFEVSPREADVLIAEGWAEPAVDRRRSKLLPRRAMAADSARSPRKKPRN